VYHRTEVPYSIDIVVSVGISARSVGWHVGYLIDLSIIRESKDGKYKRYELKESNPIYILLIQTFGISGVLELLKCFCHYLTIRRLTRCYSICLSWWTAIILDIELFNGVENAIAAGIEIFFLLLLAVAPNIIAASIKMVPFLVIMLKNSNLQINKKISTTISERASIYEEKLLVIYMHVLYNTEKSISVYVSLSQKMTFWFI